MKKLENRYYKQQMDSSSCFFRNPLSWISILVCPLLVLAGFLGYGFLPILLTSTVLIFSTLIFTFSKQKAELKEKVVVKDEILTSTNQENTTICESTQQKTGGNEEESCGGQIDDYLARSSPVTLSESECLGRSSTSEDSEVDWMFRDNFQSPDCSDGSISDEESLIEIALPSGHYVGHQRQEELKPNNAQKKLPDFDLSSFFKQHGLVELLAELNDMNEEENLIEIDISMGSIKCPRFEIEA